MPLSKAHNRERMRRLRKSVQPVCNLNLSRPVQPKSLKLVQPKSILGLKIEGNRILGLSKHTEHTADDIPWYDSTKHKPGDKVRVTAYGRTKVIVIPELDGDGHPM